MPVSYFEYIFYSLCLKNGIPIFSVRQDAKQDIRGIKVKNFDFICHTKSKVYLIDVKGSAKLAGDVKATKDDINSMKTLKKLYGRKAEALFVFLWLEDSQLQKDTFNQKFKIKAIDVDTFDKFKKLQKGWGGVFYRCPPKKLKNIWDFFPEFKKLIK